MRCLSLVDWPVYLGLGHTMQASKWAQAGGRRPALQAAPVPPWKRQHLRTARRRIADDPHQLIVDLGARDRTPPLRDWAQLLHSPPPMCNLAVADHQPRHVDTRLQGIV
jgi:hypothetical protein